MFNVGDRIRLVKMDNDPDPVPDNMTGTVTHVCDLGWGVKLEWQVSVNWDNGRTLSLICPPDRAVRI